MDQFHLNIKNINKNDKVLLVNLKKKKKKKKDLIAWLYIFKINLFWGPSEGRELHCTSLISRFFPTILSYYSGLHVYTRLKLQLEL